MDGCRQFAPLRHDRPSRPTSSARDRPATGGPGDRCRQFAPHRHRTPHRPTRRSSDGFAIGVMHKLGRSPKPLGELLTRVTGSERQRNILSSHPVSAERLDRMTREDRPVTGPPLLTDAEWTALKKICG